MVCISWQRRHLKAIVVTNGLMLLTRTTVPCTATHLPAKKREGERETIIYIAVPEFHTTASSGLTVLWRFDALKRNDGLKVIESEK